MAAYRLVPQDGRPVVTELRIFPAGANEPQRREHDPQGRRVGSRDRRGEDESPRGGLGSRRLRKVPVDTHLHLVPDIVEQMERTWGADALYGQSQPFGRVVGSPRSRFKVSGSWSTFDHFRRVPRGSRRRLRAGDANAPRSPVKVLAATRGYSIVHMRDLVFKAPVGDAHRCTSGQARWSPDRSGALLLKHVKGNRHEVRRSTAVCPRRTSKTRLIASVATRSRHRFDPPRRWSRRRGVLRHWGVPIQAME